MTGVILLGLAAAVVWKLYQWSRAPHDAPLRSVTLCLLSAALSYPLAMPGGASGVDTVAGHGTAKLIQNVLLLLTVYFLMCFYLYSADEQTGRLRARREALVVAAVAAAITVAAQSVPHDVFAGSFSTADMTIPQIAFFYAGAGLYLMYALGVAGRWTRRYARMSRRPHATGLWMAAIGLSAMAVACAVRAVFVVIRWSGKTVPQQLMTGVAFLLVVSILLFFVGVTYPGARARVTSVRLWVRRRRDHRRLAPLWQLLAEAYPENVLQPASSELWDRWRARGVHRRYHRRIVECRDGLVDVSPYLADASEDTEVLDLPPAVLADRLRHAVNTIGKGALATRPAVPLAVPKEDNREADVRQLIAVSDALRLSA
ncbi:MAB_1171c family putative transporter [Streptomyces sp. NPDC018833]|uniref:MAB_1171c family putative transporter n=1 Tax=Streptomyces sp. NPDC018833 TaxID=3365053 RepID=UPI0037BC7502